MGYKGKIKLHGCNGAITISADSTVRVQSRNRSVPPLLRFFFFFFCFYSLHGSHSHTSWPAAQVHRRGEQGPGQVGQSQRRLLRVAVASRAVLPAARLWGVRHVAHRLRRVVRARRAERRNVSISHISHRSVRTLILSVRAVRVVRVVLLAVCRAVPCRAITE